MKRYLIFFVFPCLLMPSCTKQLNLEPISIMSTASFWKTEDDAKGVIRGMYARLRGVTATNLYIWGESRSQNLRQSVGNDFANLRNFDNTLDATTAGPGWNSLYQVVNDANLVIKYLPAITFNVESEKQRIIAEAYTMRAFCYFVMAKTWGDVPLVEEPTEGYNPEVIYKERTPVEQVFTFIKSDIAQALALFPDNNFANGRNRWSRVGVNALKGDVYLWTGKRLTGGDSDIAEALAALTEVENSEVGLLDDFESIFDYTNKGNKEIIMANAFIRLESSGTFMANMYLDAYPPNSDPNTMAVIGTIGGGNYWTLTDEVLAKFNDTDQRKSATFTELYSFDQETETYSKFYGCIQRKFNGMIDGGSRYFLDDVILYRYADVLLMKAEAQNALNQDPADAINRVRARAYGDDFEVHRFISGSREANDDAILEERLLELLYEGKYWWDILRFDKTRELIPYFREHPQDTYKYLWPLSLGILSAEPKVTQNPGYQ